MTKLTLSALLALTSLTAATSGALAQDIDLAAGKTSFNKCLACHAVGEGGKASSKVRGRVRVMVMALPAYLPPPDTMPSGMIETHRRSAGRT